MKNVIEIQRLTNEHRGFLALLCGIDEHLPALNTNDSRFGRPRLDDRTILRAYFAKHFYQIDKNNLLRQRLLNDSSLRRICGLDEVPSEATLTFERGSKKH
jgi:hypothetical protein